MDDFPIEKIRSWSGGPFLTVEWPSTIDVGRFRTVLPQVGAEQRHWVGKPITITKPVTRTMRGMALDEVTMSRISLRSNAAETAEELTDYISLLQAAQAVMVELDDVERYGA
jgi:hypothetical protein